MSKMERLEAKLLEIQQQHPEVFAERKEADGSPYILMNKLTARRGIYEGMAFLSINDPSLPKPIALEVERAFLEVFIG